jgi:hypothetical protein
LPCKSARVLTTLLAAAALGACGSQAGSGSQGTPTAATSPTPSGPATADLTFVGDTALSAPLAKVSIQCQVPRLDGSYILISGTPQGQSQPAVTLFITISAGSVVVDVGSGSGASLSDRQFSGTGTSGFNAATGVHLSGALTETTAATAKKGTLGVLTSVSGSVSCGNQTIGTSTIRVTGTSAEGAVDFTLSPARVVCRSGASGYFIGASGIVTVTGARALVFVTLGQASLEVALERQGGPNHFYIAQGQVGTTVSSSGGQVDGTASEQNATGTPGTVHVTGNATCGSSATY